MCLSGSHWLAGTRFLIFLGLCTVLAAAEAGDSARPKLPRIAFVGIKEEALTPLWKQAIAKTSSQFLAWDSLHTGSLESVDVVFLVEPPRRVAPTPRDLQVLNLLEAFVRAGGGLLVTQGFDQMLTSLNIPAALLERFGARILLEEVKIPQPLIHRAGKWAYDLYAHVENATLPDGRTWNGLWVPVFSRPGEMTAVLPVEAVTDDPWHSILSLPPPAVSAPVRMGLESWDAKARAAGFSQGVPIGLARSFGQGRVAYIGINPLMVLVRKVAGEDLPIYQGLMRDGFRGQPSHLMDFYLGLLEWLASGTRQTGANLPQVQPEKPPAPEPFRLFRGLIGARSGLSGGGETPSDFAAAAREAGYDFLVFLEDFSVLPPGGFDRLREECARLSDDRFLAVPGITYQNADGNRQFAFGSQLQMPSEFLLKQTRPALTQAMTRNESGTAVVTDLKWLYTLQGFHSHSGWYDLENSPYHPMDMRAVDAFPVFTQSAAQKEILDNTEDYAKQAANGQFLWPVALTFLDHPAEIHKPGSGIFFNIIGAHGARALDTFLNSSAGRLGSHLFPGMPPFGTMSATSGPVIELTMPRGDVDPQGDPFHECLRGWPINLTVTAPDGLSSVEIYDGGNLLRRFLPGGRFIFEYQSAVGHERQRAIWVRARSVEGREAVSRDIPSNSFLLREYQCSDRFNQLLYSMQKRPDGSDFFVSYGGDAAIADKGPWYGRIRPAGCFLFDKRIGTGAKAFDGSPENHPQVNMSPFLVENGVFPASLGTTRALSASEGAPHVVPRRVLASSDILIADRHMGGVFPPGASPVTHVWSTLLPVQNSGSLSTKARVTLPLIKPDGVSLYYWDQEFELQRDLSVTTSTPFQIGLGTFLGRGSPEVVVLRGGGKTEKPGDKTQLKKGDAIAFLGGNLGSMVVICMGEPIILVRKGENFDAGLAIPSTEKGARLSASLAFAGLHRMVGDPLAEARRVVAFLDSPDWLNVSSPEAPTHVGEGRIVLDIPSGKPPGIFETIRRWIFSADPDFSASFVVNGITRSPANVPLSVRGMRDRWSAGLHDGKNFRLLPVVESEARATLRNQEEGKPLVVGHPFVTNREELVLNMAWRDGRWQLEVHNPTDQPLRGRIRSSAGFAPFFPFDSTVEVAGGESAFFEISHPSK